MLRHKTFGAEAPLRGPLWESRWFLGAIVASVLVAFLAGSLLGRSFLSPAQRAAQAAPPKLSTITAVVRSGELVDGVVIRADVQDANPVTVEGPVAVLATSPVVTRQPLRRGDEVRVGTRVLEVSTRPVFVFSGPVPAFRTMTVGVSGVDVEQLQSGLRSLGFRVGADPKGVYGDGTARAVESFYRVRGAQIAWDEGAGVELPKDSADPGVDADSQTSTDGDASAEISRRATVPQGEIVFVPELPARVLSSSVSLGARVPDSGALDIGSGAVRIAGTVDEVTFDRLRVGMSAQAVSEVLDSTFRLKVSGLRSAQQDGTKEDQLDGEGSDGEPIGSQVTLKPVGRLPEEWVGQNVAVTIRIASSKGDVLIVPTAAVSTDSAGQTYVTVESTPDGQQRKVPVTLGIASSGEQSVHEADPGAPLTVGDKVLLGSSGR